MRSGEYLLKEGHPAVCKTEYGTWASVTWTRDPAGELVVPQANTSHPTWAFAMARVRRWYSSGKTATW